MADELTVDVLSMKIMRKAAEIAEDIELRQTCGACPEQYDAFYQNSQVGYLRLRHGTFTVDAPDPAGEEIYRAHPKGDGIFDHDERKRYLTEAKIAIALDLVMRMVT